MTSESDYYHQYKLGKDPFPVNTIDSVLFLTKEHNEVLEVIKEQITKSQKLITVLAPKGGGKSFLCNHMDMVRDPDWKITLVRARADMGIEDLAEAFVVQIFKDEAGERTKVVSQLHKYLEWSAHKKVLPVLLVDDADKLPQETLEFILQLAELRYGESLFRFVLFATEDINSLLEGPVLKEMTAKIVHRVTVPALSQEQLRSYIEKRLSLCGGDGKPVFTEEEIKQIFETSGGLPGGINQQARKILRDSVKTKASGEGSGLSSIVFGFIVILTAVVLYLVFNQQESQDSGSVSTTPVEQELMAEEPVTETAAIQTRMEETQAVEVTPMVAEPIASAAEITQETETVPEADEAEDEVELTGYGSMDMPGEESLAETESVVHPLVHESEEEIMTGTPGEADEPVVDEADMNVELSQELPEAMEQAGDVEMPVVEETLPVTATEEPGSAAAQEEEETPGATTAAGTALAGETVQEADVTGTETEADGAVEDTMVTVDEEITEEPAAATATGEMLEGGCQEENIFRLDEVPGFIACVRGAGWLRQQPTTAYVLQLISSKDVDSVEKLLKGQDVDKDQLSGYTNYTPSGKPRYLLYFGIYPDNTTAREGVGELPSGLQKIKPWPRKIGDIMKELDALAARGY